MKDIIFETTKIVKELDGVFYIDFTSEEIEKYDLNIGDDIMLEIKKVAK